MHKGGTSHGFFSNLLTGRKSNDYDANINTAVALGKYHVPLKHKQLASNYVLIKKIFGFAAASIPITNSDRNVLLRHGFQPLEYTTIAQINRQIEQRIWKWKKINIQFTSQLRFRLGGFFKYI